MSLPNKKYRLILADPAWKYNNVRTGGSMNSGAAHHYNTMSMSELFALDIPIFQRKIQYYSFGLQFHYYRKE